MEKLHWLYKLENERRDSLHHIKRITDLDAWGKDTKTPHQFFYEIIANADDVGATKAKLSIDKNKIIFQHNGKPFTKEDVENITSYKKRKKENKLDKIGNFGSGFKTIHQFCDEPKIYTLIDKELIIFKIEEKIIPCKLKVTKREEKDLINQLKKYGPTKFVFDFNNKKNSGNQLIDIKSFKKFINENNEEFLLFLPNIKEIMFNIDKTSFKFIKDINKIDENLFKVSLLNQNKSNKFFYIYSKKCSLPEYEANNKASLSVAYKYNEKRKKFLQVNNDKNLFVTFRTQESFEYKFCINAPFRTTESRISVQEENIDNQNLSKLCEEVVLNSILKLKEHKLLNISFFDLLPLEKDNINNRFENIKNKILFILREEAIWPVNKAREFLKIDKIIFGEQEYKKTFSNEDLQYFGISKKWLDVPAPRTKTLLKDLDVKEFDSYNFKEDIDWDSILVKKSEKKLFAIYRLLNSKLDSFDLKNLPIIKSEDGNFYKGTSLRFPSNNQSQQALIKFVNKNFLNNKKYPKLKEFFIKSGVIEIKISDLIKTSIKNYGLVFDEKINVGINKYEKLLKDLVESENELNPNLEPYLIDENFKCRRGDELYIDNPIYPTKLSIIYKDFSKYKIYFPKNIDNSLYLGFLKKLNIQIDLKVENLREIYSSKIERYFYSVQGRPTGNSNPYYADYWINDLEDIIYSINLEKSLFIADVLNNSIMNDPDISKAKYSKSSKSPIIDFDSSLILFLKNNNWIPDLKGEFKKPSDLNQETVDKNFYEKIDNRVLDLINFNEKDANIKDFLKEHGVDPWVLEHKEEVAFFKAQWQSKNNNDLKRKKFGKSHGTPLDDDAEMSDDFDNNAYSKNKNISKFTSQKNYREEEKQSVKQNYTYHCQMCYIKDYKDNSYSMHTENRRKMSEDAHIIKDSDGGPAISGNLLSLCTYHHHLLGDSLTWHIILKSIKSNGSKWKDGIIHQLKLLDGDSYDIYFRENHKEKVIQYLTDWENQENQKVINFPPNKK